jgi:predicted solute-binding protein
VQLARVILRERFGIEPEILTRAPELNAMLSEADAALLIGDPALRIDVENQPYEDLDLGAEWYTLTGLPFVFAAWAGKPGFPVLRVAAITRRSYEFGNAHLAEIIEHEYNRRGISRELAERYLTRHIRFDLGSKEQDGLDAFLQLANLAKPALAAGL